MKDSVVSMDAIDDAGAATTANATADRHDARLQALLEQERLLRYPAGFGAAEAFALGEAIAELAPQYDRGAVVRIVRECDDLVLFQWAMDDKAPRNVLFAEGKRRAAQLCGHASLWTVAENELCGAWAEPFDMAAMQAVASGKAGISSVPPCYSGGAFPLCAGIESEWVATVTVSGLHDGCDHELVVRALCRVLGYAYGSEIPVYPGVPR